jgi:hypothetical protein
MSIYDIALLLGFSVSVFGLAAARGSITRFFRFLVDILSDKPDDDTPAIGSADAVRIWTKVLWLAYPEARLLCLALLNSFLSAASSFLHPVYLGRAIDAVSEALNDKSKSAEVATKLTEIFFLIVILEMLKGITAYGHERLNNNVGDFVRQRAQVYRVCKVALH